MSPPEDPRENDPAGPEPTGVSVRIVEAFLDGPLPLLIIVFSLLAGVAALWLTPREEEPQIVVPLADVLIDAPGLSARQVERQVTIPLEKLLYQIDGVEYVYSMSRSGGAIVTVRFHVGENREDSLVKIFGKLESHRDQVPPSVASWVVKPVEIDDVPIVVATLWSEEPERLGDHELRRLAEELEIELQAIPNTNRVTIHGGRPRVVRIELIPDALAARRTAPLEVAWALGVHNVQLPAGAIEGADREIRLEAGTFLSGVRQLENLVVNVVDGIPVYLRDVARVIDGPDEPVNYTWIGWGPGGRQEPADPEYYPAVSLAVAKKRGTNAVWVARDVEAKLAEATRELLPAGVHITITRNYGETANEKVDELVGSLGVAVLTVVIFIGLVLGWRAALVIALAVPVTYGATLLVNLVAGYTINRVTLFALILSLGLLVDDPITHLENIMRYYRIGKWTPRRSIVRAIYEIRWALIMSTVAIVLSFSPMFFITGMMGPYMRPMALNVPIAVMISTVVAFCVTPFVARLALEPPVAGEQEPDIRQAPIYRIYDFLLRPLLRRRAAGWAFLGVIGLLFVVALALVAFRLVPLKMLPFDNKNEFQVIIDMPEGTTLERTEAVARALGDRLRRVPEVTHFTAFVGLSSPMDFNGMVRHYFLREGSNVADLRVNLLHKSRRAQQSHELLLRIRGELEAVAAAHGASIQLVELPPGPPVIATLTGEVYGRDDLPYETLQQAALTAAERLRAEPLVVDVDSSVEADQARLVFSADKEKAALSGVGTEEIAQTLALAVAGLPATTLNLATEAHPLPIVLRLARPLRSDADSLGALFVKGRPGILKLREGGQLRDAPQPMVQLGEIGSFEMSTVDQTIYHKNLRRVAYVFADTAGRAPADVVLDVGADLKPGVAADPRPVAGRTYFAPGGGIPWSLPAGTSVNWAGEGEWKITIDVFRDLGLAFGAAVIGIFFVLLIQTGSAVLSGIMITSIPLVMIGIMPGFWLLNNLGEGSVAGLPNPTFFTATAMIGMIALAGIVVRNSVILVEFIHDALRQGMALEEALVQSGAIRTRPIFLTAGTTLLGNIVITLDPIFSGLAWSIIFGVAASTLFTLGVIPVAYNLVYARDPRHGLPKEREE